MLTGPCLCAAGYIQIISQLRIPAGANQQICRARQWPQRQLAVDDEVNASAHGLQGGIATLALFHVPVDKAHILALGAQGVCHVVLGLYSVPWRQAAHVWWNTVVGVFQGQSFHPASEGRLPEEDKIF